MILPLLIAIFVARNTTPDYKVLEEIHIPGIEGWDYMSFDSNAHRLYISRSTHVQVLDVVTKKIVGDIANTQGVHGIALNTKAGKGYTSNGRDDSVSVIDLKTCKELSRIKVGSRPDAILFDEMTGMVFTFNAGSQDATAIDTVTERATGSVSLGGKPEFPQSDGKGHIFVNIEDKSEVIEFDAKSLSVVKSWPLAPGEEPSGLAINREENFLYSVCGNQKMIVSDSKAGHVVTSIPIEQGADAAVFDEETHLAFSSNGAGTLTVVGESPADEWVVKQTVKTVKSARTMALDPVSHRIYLICADSKPAKEGQRPTVVPGTVRILVVGMTP